MNVYQKIAAIYKDVQYLAKDDNVKFGTTAYKALSEEKVTTILRAKMVEHGLIVYPVEMVSSRQGNISHVDVKYRIVNTEDPADFIEVVSCGDGSDTQDKGAGKAMTYAFKYMWLRTFAIPTGEDPDKIASAQIDAEDAERAQKAAAASGKGNNTPAPAPAEKPPISPPFVAVCGDCGKAVTDYKQRTAIQIVDYSMLNYAKPLCGACLAKRIRAERAEKEKQNV